MQDLQAILKTYQICQQAGKQMAIATIVQTHGSVYRRPGARMLLVEDGQMIGAISGGCLEGDVFEKSQALLFGNEINADQPIVARYDTTAAEEIVWGLGLGCNGIVDVLIEPLSSPAAAQSLAWIQQCYDQRDRGAIATVFQVRSTVPSEQSTQRPSMRPSIQVGDRVFLSRELESSHPDLVDLVIADLQQVRSQDQSQVKTYYRDHSEFQILLEVIRPPIALVIFGAGHDAIPLVEQAKQLGWNVTLCDHRPGYTRRDRFPLADQIVFCEPEQVEKYQTYLTDQTAAVVMTHHYLRDQIALKTLLPAAVPYIGLLGPKRRSQQMLQELQQSGVAISPQQLQRLYTPIGLDIGAETPQEIALAIVAEIQAVFAQRSGSWLRDRTQPIHD